MTGAGGGAFTGRSAADAEEIIANAATEPKITRIVPSIMGLNVETTVRRTPRLGLVLQRHSRGQNSLVDAVIQVKVPLIDAPRYLLEYLSTTWLLSYHYWNKKSGAPGAAFP
jgi:hypothetical protein